MLHLKKRNILKPMKMTWILKNREKLLKNFDSKLTKGESKGKEYDIDLENDIRIFIRSVKVATNNQINNTSQVDTTNNNGNLSSLPTEYPQQT